METVLVVGASSRIGEAATKMFLECGYEVFGTYCSKKPQMEAPHDWIQANLASAEGARELAFRVKGLVRGILHLVYCAGQQQTDESCVKNPGFLEYMTYVNAYSFYELVLSLESQLKSATITLDVLDLTGARSADSKFYKASKACARSLMISLAAFLAPTVRVNGIDIGAVDEDRGQLEAYKRACPMRRIGEFDEAAEAIFALTAGLTYTTGSTIKVDGGRSLR